MREGISRAEKIRRLRGSHLRRMEALKGNKQGERVGTDSNNFIGSSICDKGIGDVFNNGLDVIWGNEGMDCLGED